MTANPCLISTPISKYYVPAGLRPNYIIWLVKNQHQRCRSFILDERLKIMNTMTLDPSDLFGMWKDNPKTIENIRQKA